MISVVTALVVLACVLAIFATTKTGRRFVSALGLRGPGPGAATSDDVDFLLGRCGNDPKEVARRIAAERERFPDLREADHYRRAIRRLLAEAKSGSEPASGPGGEAAPDLGKP